MDINIPRQLNHSLSPLLSHHHQRPADPPTSISSDTVSLPNRQFDPYDPQCPLSNGEIMAQIFADLHTAHRTAAEELFDDVRRENSLAAETILLALFSSERAARKAGLSLLERLQWNDRKAAARLMVGMILSQPLENTSPPPSLLGVIKSISGSSDIHELGRAWRPVGQAL